MEAQRILRSLLLSAAALWVLIVTGCAPTAKEEMPITTSSEEAKRLFIEGRDLFEKIRFQESIKYYEKAITEDPDFALAYFYLAAANRSTMNPKEFFEYLKKAIALVDKASEGERLFILSIQARISDNPVKAKKLLEKLVKIYPKDKRTHYQLGLYYFGQLDYPAAIEEFKRALEIAPDFAPPHNEMGYAYSWLGQYAEAEKALKKYAELLPEEPNPYDSLGELLMKEGKFDESIEAYKKALSLDPNFFFSYIGIGTDLMFKGQSVEGRKEFQKLYDIAPTDAQRAQALFAMACSYIDEGNLNKALEEVQKSYAIHEKNKDAAAMAGDLRIMGDLLLESGKLHEAKAKYVQAVEVIEQSDLSKEVKDDTKQGLLYNEARIALKADALAVARGKAEEYRKEAEAGNDPLEMQTYHELAGMIALHEKSYDDALKELQKANQRNPRNLYRTAEAYLGKGDKEKARDMWEKVANFNEINYDYTYVRRIAKKRLEEVEKMAGFTLRSSAFKSGARIPSKYTCDREDVNPPLEISDIPENAQSLALIMDDPDAPGRTFVHWTVWNISPDTKEIPENSMPTRAVEGMTDFGRPGYGGPCPPSGTHRYFFKLYALDSRLDLRSDADKAALERAMAGHILAQTELIGLYSRR